jgi:uncharacterized protein
MQGMSLHRAPAPTADGYGARLADLRARIRALGSVAVAFSGGVDSGVLLHVACQELGERAAGVIADSPSLPRRELEEARGLARAIGARLHEVRTAEADDPRYRANQGDRCYFCKTALFAAMEPWAQAQGFAALAFGEITDDLADHRPGARAAREFGVVAPLREAAFSKADVRRYAREAGLPVADKPAAACLASRIPTGTEVTLERLARVEAAEAAVHRLGLRQVRVRHHGEVARLEVGRDELPRARELEPALRQALAAAGFLRFSLHAYQSPAPPPAGSASGE